MSEKQLNYRFHNPNSVEATANALLRVLIEANRSKVEQAIQAARTPSEHEASHESCSV